MWTQFWDMHSGGGLKEKPYAHIYIEAPQAAAEIIFYNRFGHNPRRVSCTCCGDDYSIEEHESLSQLTGYERGCRYLKTPKKKDGLYDNNDPVILKGMYLEEGEEPPGGYEVSGERHSLLCNKKYLTVDEYGKQEGVLVITTADIKDDERKGELPEQGYVWID